MRRGWRKRSLGTGFFVLGCLAIICIHKMSLKPPELQTSSARKVDLEFQVNRLKNNTVFQTIQCSSITQATSSGEWYPETKQWKPDRCKLIEPTDSNRLLRYKLHKVVFIGDSQTWRLSKHARANLRCRGKFANKSSRCTFSQYLGVDRSMNWTAPVAGIEGPRAFGKENPWCSDCSGCDAYKKNCHGSTWTFEYLSVEFARDVEIQSTLFGTTQENVIHYLTVSRPDVIVYSVGVHDLGYNNVSVYADNLEWFTRMLKREFPVCKILFINTAAVKEKVVPDRFKRYTNNYKLLNYNKAANAIMEKFGIPYIDNWAMSNNIYALEHFLLSADDGVHMHPSYYSHLFKMVHIQFHMWFN